MKWQDDGWNCQYEMENSMDDKKWRKGTPENSEVVDSEEERGTRKPQRLG